MPDNGVLQITFVGLYLLPGLLAMSLNRRQTVAIFATNILLGWTVLGWIIALIWASIKDSTA